MKKEVKVTVIRPELTDDEREERMKEIKRRLADFWIAVQKQEVKKDVY